MQQLEVGSGQLFLNSDPNIYCYSSDNTRLSFLWKKCFKDKIWITLKNAWTPSGSDNDCPTIMDFAVKDKHLQGNKKLQQINRCQLYLKLLWPSDLLIDPNSTEISKLLIQAQRPKLNQLLCFPYQPKPDKYTLQLWKEFIYHTFCNI
jgi:hypothetical protein